MVGAFFWTTPTIPSWETSETKNKHVCNSQHCFFGLISKQQVDLPLSTPFQLFGSHPAFFGVEPGVVCHPIFASLLSYVAELEMEGAGM